MSTSSYKISLLNLPQTEKQEILVPKTTATAENGVTTRVDEVFQNEATPIIYDFKATFSLSKNSRSYENQKLNAPYEYVDA